MFYFKTNFKCDFCTLR